MEEKGKKRRKIRGHLKKVLTSEPSSSVDTKQDVEWIARRTLCSPRRKVIKCREKRGKPRRARRAARDGGVREGKGGKKAARAFL